MCVISAIGDNYQEMFPSRYPTYPNITRAEFDKLKEEVQELKKLLKAAKEFDAATGQPNCEMDEKIDFLKQLGKYLDVDMTEVFK